MCIVFEFDCLYCNFHISVSGGGDHPGGAVDSEIARIADEALTVPEGPITAEGGVDRAVEATTQADELEV